MSILLSAPAAVKSHFTSRAYEIGLCGGNTCIAEAFPRLSARLVATHGVAFNAANQAGRLERAYQDGIEAGLTGAVCDETGPADWRLYDAFERGHRDGASEAAHLALMADDAAMGAAFELACQVGYLPC